MAGNLVQDVLDGVTQHLSPIFRYMLPGVLVVGGAALAYPESFDKHFDFDLKSWPHLAVLAVISIVVGNTWFAINRFGILQLFDLCFWRMGIGDPAWKKDESFADAIGRHVLNSLKTPNPKEPDQCAKAREHVHFRASAVLLIFTVSELSAIFAITRSKESIFDGLEILLWIIAILSLGLGIWQDIITRRIDYFVVNRPTDDTTLSESSQQPATASENQTS